MRLTRWVILLLCFSLVPACSTVSRVDEVAVPAEEISITQRYGGSVQVKVRGGDPSYVTNAVFTEALLSTLTSSGLFETASTTARGDYELRVIILDNRHSAMAGSYFMESRWKLLGAGGEAVWSEDINTEGESVAFGGVDRAQRSAERAAYIMIKRAVEGMGEVVR